MSFDKKGSEYEPMISRTDSDDMDQDYEMQGSTSIISNNNDFFASAVSTVPASSLSASGLHERTMNGSSNKNNNNGSEAGYVPPTPESAGAYTHYVDANELGLNDEDGDADGYNEPVGIARNEAWKNSRKSLLKKKPPKIARIDKKLVKSFLPIFLVLLFCCIVIPAILLGSVFGVATTLCKKETFKRQSTLYFDPSDVDNLVLSVNIGSISIGTNTNPNETRISMSWTMISSRSGYEKYFHNTTLVMDRTLKGSFEYLDATSFQYGCPRYVVELLLPQSVPKHFDEVLMSIQEGTLNAAGLSANRIYMTVHEKGKVTAQDLRSTAATIMVQEGDIDIDKISMTNATDTLTVQSYDGDVSISHINGGSVVTTTENGSSNLQYSGAYAGSFDLKARNGKVVLNNRANAQVFTSLNHNDYQEGIINGGGAQTILGRSYRGHIMLTLQS